MFKITHSLTEGGISVEFPNIPGVFREPLAFQVISIKILIAKDRTVTK